MINALLRNYLTWQSEIGTDEIILPDPWIKKSSSSASTPVQNKRIHLEDESAGIDEAVGMDEPVGMNETKVGGHFPQPFQHAPAFQPTSPSNLFGNLARALETAGKKEDTDRFPTGRSKIDPESKPHLEFSQLSDFQNYLEKNSNSIFGIVEEASLVQSMGPISSPLALVTYSSGNIETDPPSLFNQASAELLEKMMRAIHLDYTQLYRTSMLKHNPGSKIWGRRELVPILNFLMSELGLVKSPFVLLLGESCAQAVLKTTKTMDEMRQIPFRGGNWEFVVSYHPDELLKREELKRKAWEDLQWLQRRMKQNQVQP